MLSSRLRRSRSLVIGLSLVLTIAFCGSAVSAQSPATDVTGAEEIVKTPETAPIPTAEAPAATASSTPTATSPTSPTATPTSATATPTSQTPTSPTPAPTSPTSAPTSTSTSTSTSSTEPSDALSFNFAGAPWSEVLRWFAEQADLSLQMDTMPAGTVNFSDPNKLYTVSEGLDLINRLLLDRGWAVVRRGRMLLLVDLEGDNAEKLISEMAELVTPESFDERGNSDIVRCVFPLGAITPEQAREELSQVIGPWGRINVLAGARQVIVTETVGKLRVINEVLQAATKAQSSVVEITLQHRSAEEILEIARPLLGLEAASNSSDEIRLSVSMYGDRIFATGSQSKLELLNSVVEKADREMPKSGTADDEKIAAPELRTHPVVSANLQTVYDVLQTMIAGTPEARLAMDANRGAIIAFGRPEMQDKIRNTITELEGSGRDFTIIDLKRLEPAQALLTINKFFGVTEAGGGNAPVVDGDPATKRLWVRGTADQVESVKRLIAELENDPLAGGLGENVRILPLTGSAASDTLRQIETLWPLTGRRNQIRVITPSLDRKDQSRPEDRSNPRERFRSEEQPGLLDTNHSTSNAFQTLVWQNAEATPSEPTATPDNDYAGDDIIIQMTPAGLVIASRDQRALDMIEQLITSMGAQSADTSALPTIFWLRYLKADIAAELVAGVLGGADASGSAGSLTESVMGGLGGGMLGGLLGMGGGGGGGEESQTRTVLTSRGSVNIVPDNRLNALIVQAPPSDLDFIRIVLKEIDLEESPETVQTVARPSLIPVVYQDAAEVAKIVTAVFAEKVGEDKQGGGDGGRGGQPNPQDIIKALRGGGGGGQPKPKSESTKIIVAVDTRSNSLVVTAIPQDLQAIRDLVETLDQRGLESEEKVEVVAMGGSVRPEIMLQALQSVTGKAPTTATSSTTKTTSSSTSSSNNSSSTPSTSSPEDIQRRIDYFRSRFGGGDTSGRSSSGRSSTGRSSSSRGTSGFGGFGGGGTSGSSRSGGRGR